MNVSPRIPKSRDPCGRPRIPLRSAAEIVACRPGEGGAFKPPRVQESWLVEIISQLPLGLVPSSHYEPQGGAYLWDARLIWLNAISEGAIVLAYYCIPFSLLSYVRQKKD